MKPKGKSEESVQNEKEKAAALDEKTDKDVNHEDSVVVSKQEN